MRLLRRRWAVQAAHAEAGFTLVEFASAMVLFSILSAMAVVGLRAFTAAHAESGTKSELVSALRYAQTRAITEGTTYCVDFSTTNKWSVYRVAGLGTGTLPVGFSCVTSGTKMRGPFSTQSTVSVTSPVFTQRDGSTTTYALFYPRGSASPGSLTIRRSSTSKQYVLTVEALTARVEVN
jgi:prepilin-type N-terminal cleavage/methylation domain-containing protein